ncbi:phospholipid phosphatase 3 [Nematostella vectensis]|uniref:phospholipid phosphatase 3 n=1 Tax=Nematostella vectensis TaxID=45351 RepID=UPI002077300B|nr:phospholipid phosphatase 3 [Nematostella vectensis]
MSSSRQLFWTLDVVCFVVIGLADLLLHATKLEPSNRGFFCDDESIKRPLRPEHVPTNVALAAGISVVVVAIIVGETAREFVFKAKARDPCRNSRNIACGPITMKAWQQRLCVILFMFVFGGIVTSLITDIGKLSVGRQRPYFLAVCKPDPLKINCTAGQYTELSVCTGDKAEILEARLSFPSGHSSFAAYTMVFLSLYLEAIIPTRKTVLLKPFLQVSAISLGLLCALSRIFDYRHHWGDVLAGLAIGTLIAFYVTFKPLQLFSQGPCTCCKQHSLSNVSIGREIDVESQPSPDAHTKL